MFVLQPNPSLKLRGVVALRSVVNGNGRLFSSSSSSKNDDDGSSSSDDEKKPKSKSNKVKPTKKQENPSEQDGDSAASRLNRLLASMQMDDNYSLTRKALDMAKPGEANRKRKEAGKQNANNKDVFVAAKNVAALMGDENSKKQTESDLLSKLLGSQKAVEGKADAGAAAGNTGGGPEVSLAELIVGMKIDRRQQPKEETRGDFVRRTLSSSKSNQKFSKNYSNNKEHGYDRNTMTQRKREPETYSGSVNLFGGQGMGIFKNPSELTDSPDMLSTWSKLHQHELKLQVTHPPSNYFEKIARWTDKNKVWQFPIDNEQGMDEEANVDFSEHIFLEQHLEPWCPDKGPIRHFMELVCVGLSKNYHITAREKKEHILWYRDYFQSKKDMLKDLMNKDKMNEITQKQKNSGKQLEA